MSFNVSELAVRMTYRLDAEATTLSMTSSNVIHLVHDISFRLSFCAGISSVTAMGFMSLAMVLVFVRYAVASDENFFEIYIEALNASHGHRSLR
jgi:hypothetical protein